MKLREIFGFLTAYLLWILTAASGIYVLFRIERTLNLIWPLLSGNRWSLRAVNRFYLVGAAVAWLSYVMVTEEFFRRSITDRPTLRQRTRAEASDHRSSGEDGLLRRLGLDVLARRFLIAASIPLVLFILERIAYGLTFLSL